LQNGGISRWNLGLKFSPSGNTFIRDLSNYANDYGDGVKGTDAKESRSRSKSSSIRENYSKTNENAVLFSQRYLLLQQLRYCMLLSFRII
jgi:1,4-dihydroxy-2-naphthoate octaprenyltransferase